MLCKVLHTCAQHGMDERQENRSNDHYERAVGSIAGNDV